MFPMLGKMCIAIDLFCLVPGESWVGCPESDKQKKYKCTVQQGWYDGLERRFRTGTGTGTGSGNRVAYLSVALN